MLVPPAPLLGLPRSWAPHAPHPCSTQFPVRTPLSSHPLLLPQPMRPGFSVWASPPGHLADPGEAQGPAIAPCLPGPPGSLSMNTFTDSKLHLLSRKMLYLVMIFLKSICLFLICYFIEDFCLSVRERGQWLSFPFLWQVLALGFSRL